MNYFYSDKEKEIIKEELLTTKAVEWAKSFINPQRTHRGPRNPKLTSAQLRRFYNDVKALESKIASGEFEKNKPIIKMLKSKVAYASPVRGRDRKVPIEFRNFLEEMVDNINDLKDFEAFCLTFEAVVGYFYGEGGK